MGKIKLLLSAEIRVEPNLTLKFLAHIDNFSHKATQSEAPRRTELMPIPFE